MSRTLASLSISAMLLAGTGMADVPRVVTDIAPVHSLVARVMQGTGSPDLILPPGASPHEYSLRPSEAAALQDADIVIWMGPQLAPWMRDAIETLASKADHLTLLEAAETRLLDIREGALFESHSHGDDDHGHDDDHADGDHAHEHEDDHHHDHAEDEEHAQDHGAHDAHAWLSPENAAVWVDLIAAELSSADPENADNYLANAAAAREELAGLSADVIAILDPVRSKSFIVFHDAFQYFEADFDFPAAGAISLSDAAAPSPARIAEIQERVRHEEVDCVLAEPQFNPGLVSTVLDGTDANTAIIDPIGATLEPGPGLYPQLIRNIATTLASCL
ncbi:zinc ABC transporter substrate-binding protein [Sedimentitalea sp. XS_ASV28]|uniref:zinc ABC transporter substrate-binding protein n=1 Tax=Sedimentitalea sp. XS_ASV28 TaxID=3241296 RepID=UPI0035181CDE